MVKKTVADGRCTACDGAIPPDSLNRFFCSDGCGIACQRQFMPELFPDGSVEG